MKKTYIAPAISADSAVVEGQILASSYKISDTEVTEGWAKDAGEWGDIWDEAADE